MVSVGKYSWGPSIKDFRTDGVGGGGGDSIKTDIYRQGRTGFNQMGMSTFRY